MQLILQPYNLSIYKVQIGYYLLSLVRSEQEWLGPFFVLFKNCYWQEKVPNSGMPGALDKPTRH